jgi:hypothetical protein
LGCAGKSIKKSKFKYVLTKISFFGILPLAILSISCIIEHKFDYIKGNKGAVYMLSLKDFLQPSPETRERERISDRLTQARWVAEFPIPHLSTMQKYYADSSTITLILGLCEDGLPLITNLRETDPGSFLIIGNSSDDNRPLMDTFLANLVGFWGDEGIQIDWLSPFACGPAFQIPDSAPNSGLMLERLVIVDYLSRIKQRVIDNRGNGTGRSFTVLLIDGLETILHQFGAEVRDKLNWLNVFGRKSGVRMIASFGLDAAYDIDDQTLHSFGLTIAGPVSSPTWARYINGNGNGPVNNLVPGSQYQVIQSGQPIRFWLPRLD